MAKYRTRRKGESMDEEIKCACGCGEVLLRFNNQDRARRFLQGHNRRGMRREAHSDG